MAKKTNGAVTLAAELSPDEKSDLDIMQQFVDLGGNVKVHVYRMPGRQHLGNIVPEELDPDVVYERYGGGEFVFRAQKNGVWAKGIPQAAMNIEGPPKIRGDDAAPPSTELDKLRDQIEALKNPGEPQTGTDLAVAMMGMMGTMVSTVLAASLERKAEVSATDMFMLSREMAKDQIEAVTAASSGAGEDPLITEGLIPLVHEVTALRKQGEKEPERTLPNPAPKVPETTAELAVYIARWCAPHCAIGANPSLRAELFLEELELRNPAMRAAVVELAAIPNVLDLWVGFAPSVAADREWHEDFIEAVDYWASPASGLPDSEGGPGHDGDVAEDGAAIEDGGDA